MTHAGDLASYAPAFRMLGGTGKCANVRGESTSVTPQPRTIRVTDTRCVRAACFYARDF
jgi:hypothetical protein